MQSFPREERESTPSALKLTCTPFFPGHYEAHQEASRSDSQRLHRLHRPLPRPAQHQSSQTLLFWLISALSSVSAIQPFAGFIAQQVGTFLSFITGPNTTKNNASSHICAATLNEVWRQKIINLNVKLMN